jgi:alpha-glucosidase
VRRRLKASAVSVAGLSKPAARAWCRDVIAEQVAGAGVDGWMADYGEELPFDAKLHRGTPAQWHNRWPEAEPG